jgi:pimeloyl-ACP methyl ester carboxylesterase
MWQFRRSVVAATAAAAALALGADAAPEKPPRLVDSHPCLHTPGFTCSTLTVPLDPGGRRPGHLEVRVAAADDRAAPRGILLFLTGGPGEPGVPFVPRIVQALRGVLPAYRLVMLDQRGTGTGVLRCPGLQAAMGSSDLYPPPVSSVRSCARAIGPARSLYGTDDVVSDLEELRQALGARTWAIDGVSYGTFVAERYALAHPRRVSRLVLDSVVPHDFGFGLIPIELRASARVLRLVCGRECVSDLAAVVRRRHDGPRLLDAIVFMSIVDPSFETPGDLAAALFRARHGDPAQLDDLLATIRRWEAWPAARLSQGLHASALCADFRFPWGDAGAPLATRAADLARAGSALRPSDVAPFDRATATGNGIEQQCLPWPPTTPTPAPAPRLPPVPTLLLNGDRDLSTPLEWARREAALAPEGRLVVVHGAGHSVQTRAKSDTGRKAVVAFLMHRAQA